jgi:citrate lyase subunit beta/citryl-CoA lyase
MAARPIRTILNVPGDRIDRVMAAAAAGSDAVWIDLEEPRTPFTEEQRVAARAEVGAFLREMGPPPERPLYLVRVQEIDSGGTLRDLEAVMCEALTGVILPKVHGAGEVAAANALLAAAEAAAGIEIGRTLLYPILETAGALRNVHAIAAAPRVTYMGGAVSRFGDIVQALGYRWTAAGTETLMFRSRALVEARAGGIANPITGNWGGDLDDLDGLVAWAHQGSGLGYAGTMTSHPPHVPRLNGIYGREEQP